MRRSRRLRKSSDEGEFLWLVSLSDLMILLFVFFVTLFSFSYQKMGAASLQKIAQILNPQQNQEGATLDEVQAKLYRWIVDRKLLENIEVTQKNDALILQIKEKVLFDRGDYVLKPASQELLISIAQALEKVPAPYRLGIEGHTDDMPIQRPGIADNWELSVKRAHSVLAALNLNDELKHRTVVMGYGEMNPLVPNRDEKGSPLAENQAKNRRVTLRIF